MPHSFWASAAQGAMFTLALSPSVTHSPTAEAQAGATPSATSSRAAPNRRMVPSPFQWFSTATIRRSASASRSVPMAKHSRT